MVCGFKDSRRNRLRFEHKKTEAEYQPLFSSENIEDRYLN